MIVYIVWYQIKGEVLSVSQEQKDYWTGVPIITMQQTEQGEKTTEIDDDDIVISTGITSSVVSSTTGTTPTTGISQTKTETNTTTWQDRIKLLSGTSLYYGKIDIIDKLGIKHKYALTDSSGVRYIYLGTPSYDFVSIARALKGNIYTMSTEQEIIENKLFGQKVVFINLPEYKEKQVLMLIYLPDGIRLIQIEYAMYHKSKSHIKSLFIN